MKTFLKVVTLALFSLVAGLVTAQPMKGLTEDQSKQVSELVKKQQALITQQRAQVRVYEAQIDAAMVASKTDLSAVNALVDKKAQLQAEMQKSQLATEAQIHQIVGDTVFLAMHHDRGWHRGHEWAGPMREGRMPHGDDGGAPHF